VGSNFPNPNLARILPSYKNIVKTTQGSLLSMDGARLISMKAFASVIMCYDKWLVIKKKFIREISTKTEIINKLIN
jgi:hypothetical protein